MAEIVVEGAISALWVALLTFYGPDPEVSDDMFMLQGKLKSLEAEMSSVRTCLRKGGEDAVPILRAAEALSYDVEDILETHFPHVAKGKSWLKRGITGMFGRSHAACKFAVLIEGLRERACDLRMTYGNLDLAEGTIRRSFYRDFKDSTQKSIFNLGYPGEPGLVGFEEHIKLLVDKVCDADLQDRVISIVGMVGLGKTALAKKVYNLVQHKFDFSAMIYIPQTLILPELLQDVAKQVGLMDNEEELQENLEDKLRSHLEGKRCLFLLDNIRESQEWHRLATTILGNCKTGSRLIITSRKKIMGLPIDWSASLYELQPLDENECWIIFSQIFPQLRKNSKLESIGKKLVGKCGGSPLATIALATSLWVYEQDEHTWQELLEIMVQAGTFSRRLGCRGLPIRSVLESSYEDLPIQLRPCFLYFGLFPKDYNFSAPDIINLWIAERFIPGKEGNWEPEDVGADYLDHLVANSLIQVSTRRFNGRIRTFRVHDIVHDFCAWKGIESELFTARCATIPAKGVFSRFSISKWDFSKEEKISKWGEFFCQPADPLRAVVCTDDKAVSVNAAVEQAEQLMKVFESLRVLKVSSYQLSPYFTNRLGNFTLLKYLGCRDDSWPPRQVKLPSSMGNLKGLVTLDLRSVECIRIPEGIWKIEQLRHILLSKPSSKTMSIVDSRIGEAKSRKTEAFLPNLQTLYVVPGQTLDWSYLAFSTKLTKLGVFGSMDEVIELLCFTPKSLEILWLSCDFIGERSLDLSPFLSLHRLYLRIYTIPTQMELCLNLVKLVLVVEELKEDPMEDLKRLEKLAFLKLYADKSSIDKIACSGGPNAFPELQVLELHLPFYVKMLSVDEHAMPRLKNVRGISSGMFLEVPERIRVLCVKRGPCPFASKSS